MRSDPCGISSEAMSPSPLGFSSSKNAIFTDWCTNPPSRRTHFMRSGGWGTSRAGRMKADAAADASGRTWISELAITLIFIYFVSLSFPRQLLCSIQLRCRCASFQELGPPSQIRAHYQIQSYLTFFHFHGPIHLQNSVSSNLSRYIHI